MLKVQIINIDEQPRYDIKQLAWVKNFVSNLQKFYPKIRLNKLNLLDCDNVIAWNADLYIYPISSTQIKVGFKVLRNINSFKGGYEGMHKVTITKQANTKADALSAFLMLLVGSTIIPNSLGVYSTDLYDFLSVLEHSTRAQLVSQEFFNSKQQNEILGLLVWFNCKGKFCNSFYDLCWKVKSQLKNDGVLTILNVTDYLVLKETMLATVITS